MHNTLVILCEVISAALGVFVFLKPEMTIELQRRFYVLINWRMEPISMSKEIRNTRSMGMILIIFSLLGILGRIFMPVLVNVGYELKCCISR